eukprot:2222128-Alexandrium_andersonii.AAC.1
MQITRSTLQPEDLPSAQAQQTIYIMPVGEGQQPIEEGRHRIAHDGVVDGDMSMSLPVPQMES